MRYIREQYYNDQFYVMKAKDQVKIQYNTICMKKNFDVFAITMTFFVCVNLRVQQVKEKEWYPTLLEIQIKSYTSNIHTIRIFNITFLCSIFSFCFIYKVYLCIVLFFENIRDFFIFLCILRYLFPCLFNQI